jgi:hypothetical protein
MPWVAFGQLDRHGSNPIPSPASPSVRAATPTKLRGMESLDTAVYWSLTSCHSRKRLQTTACSLSQAFCVTLARSTPDNRMGDHSVAELAIATAQLFG